MKIFILQNIAVHMYAVYYICTSNNVRLMLNEVTLNVFSKRSIHAKYVYITECTVKC